MFWSSIFFPLSYYQWGIRDPHITILNAILFSAKLLWSEANWAGHFYATFCLVYHAMAWKLRLYLMYPFFYAAIMM
jgi:hypothetical protein